MQENNPFEDWQIGLIPHLSGFPLPVVGLIAPVSPWEGLISLHISPEAALHVKANEVTIQATRFADFQQLSLETTVGKNVLTLLGTENKINPFDLVAVVSQRKSIRKVTLQELPH